MNEDTLPVTLLVVPIRYVYLRTRKRYMYYHIIKSISLSTFTIAANLLTPISISTLDTLSTRVNMARHLYDIRVARDRFLLALTGG